MFKTLPFDMTFWILAGTYCWYVLQFDIIRISPDFKFHLLVIATEDELKQDIKW